MKIDFYGDYDRLVRVACPEYDYCLRIIVKNIAKGTKSILDLGSGTGSLIAEILKEHPYLKAYGLELQESLVDISRQKLKSPNVSFFQGDILDFKWPEADAITSSLAIHHFTNEQKESTFRRIFDNSKFFIYFDIFKGETKQQQEKYRQYIFNHIRQEGFSEDMVLEAKQSMDEHDKPMTIREQDRMFGKIGFDYRLLYFNQGFGVYLCKRKA